MFQRLELRLAAGAPVVLIDRFTNADVDQVATRNIEASAGLADPLEMLGHRRIAMIYGRSGLATGTSQSPELRT
jgi:LacI family transcriptional regulator